MTNEREFLAKQVAVHGGDEVRELIRLARERVDADYKITGHGEIGEPSNGALLLRLATALERQSVPPSA